MFDNFNLTKYSRKTRDNWQYILLDHIVYEANSALPYSFGLSTKTYALSLQFEYAAVYSQVNKSGGIKPKVWRNEKDKVRRRVQSFLIGRILPKDDSPKRPDLIPYHVHIVEQLLRLAGTSPDYEVYHNLPQWWRTGRVYMHNILNYVAGRRRNPLEVWEKRAESLINLIHAQSRCSHIFDEERKIEW
jgi:hypothetical protein